MSDHKDDNKQDQIRSHNFDGIQEYENQLPRWWVWKFILTIIFAAVYLYWFHVSDFGKGLVASFEADKQALANKAAAEPAKAQLTEDQLRAMVKDPQVTAKGAAIFKTRCTSCHGEEGEGIVGPNMTDDYWIHGGSMLNIVKTIVEGVPAKGMITWKGVLTDDEIHQVAAFIKTLKGKPVKNPKKPEGNLEKDS